MSSGADLFVVCKQCGSEVSPYVTECPYCGHRVRRRAPKLPRENVLNRTAGARAGRLPWRRAQPVASPARERGARGGRGGRGRAARWAHSARAGSAPYATIALVVCGCAGWVIVRAGFVNWGELVVAGPLHGHWWRLLTSQFAYVNGWYAFVSLGAVAIFGWLLERRHGLALVAALGLGAGVTGTLVANAVESDAIISGANAAALGLLAAWAVPDLRAARADSYYEGDLLGTGALAALLLAIPVARPEASWLAGLTGGAVGLLVGLGLTRMEADGL